MTTVLVELFFACDFSTAILPIIVCIQLCQTCHSNLSHFWEAIQAMGEGTHYHFGYPQTEFRPILRGPCAKLW